MRNIQFSSPVDALWQENELAKMHYSQVMSYLAKVVMSIPGPLIRDGGNTNPSYQLQPLVLTDLTRGFLS